MPARIDCERSMTIFYSLSRGQSKGNLNQTLFFTNTFLLCKQLFVSCMREKATSKSDRLQTVSHLFNTSKICREMKNIDSNLRNRLDRASPVSCFVE